MSRGCVKVDRIETGWSASRRIAPRWTAWVIAALLCVLLGPGPRPALAQDDKPIVPVPVTPKGKAQRTPKAPKAPKASQPARSDEGESDRAAEKADEAGPSGDAVPSDAAAPAQTPVGEDALRLGTFVPPPKPFPFPLLGDERARELYVDRAGQLYKERPYSGHVPDWNAVPTVAASGRCRVEAQQLLWVGFQNSADGSRVFVQLERDACGYVYRPDDTHIVVDLPAVTLANSNLKRDILTGAFPTSVELVHVEEVPGRGTRVVIVLKDKRPYLSAHLGQYVFVDIAR